MKPEIGVSDGVTLTKRELEVLELMAYGLTNKEIAERLAMGRRTVDTHIDHLLGKLDATTRTRAVAEAGRLGLLGGAAQSAATTQVTPTNLPFQLTALVGREDDLVEVKALLETCRLLTLSGAGGVGKTRLATRVGVDLLPAYRDGVWFNDLSTITDASLVASVVAKTLGVRENPRHTLHDTIVAGVKTKRALLVFDNCEHVIEEAAALASAILVACPDIRILATSRQSLGVSGEVVYRVRSLAVPALTESLHADNVKGYGAVELFVERAHATDTRFELSDGNASAVSEICARLDGIPLAIELAASRTNALDVHTLARRLDDRFKVLTGGSRTALPRHKTLTALIDWSYDLLAPGEKTFLNRLGVFSGAFGLDAAAAICGGDGLANADLMDLLTALVDKSLVVVQTGERRERFRLLETTRAYALEELEIGGERDQLFHRHAEYFCEQAQAADDRYGIGSAAQWLADVEADLENYRSALRWALTDGHAVEIGAAIAGALERLWFLGGLAVEARAWIAQALERISETEHPAIAARVWRAKARFLQGQPMRDSAEHALRLYDSVGDVRGAAYALRSLAYSLLQVGKVDEANDVIERAIAAFRERNDQVGVASCLGLQGVSSYVRGDLRDGRRYYVQAVAACKALGDELATADVLGNFGELEFADGHPERALRLVTESLEITTRGKEMANLAIDYNNRAAYSISLGRFVEARESAREGLRWAQAENNVWNISVALQHLALVAALEGETEGAARLIGYVNAQYKRLGLEREATEKWAFERLQAALRDRLSEEQIAELSADGEVWSEDQAVQEAFGDDAPVPAGPPP